MLRSLVVTLAIVAVPSIAAADDAAPQASQHQASQPPLALDLTSKDPAALVAQGQELAKAGEYTRAIAAFKRAQVLQPSAAHECLIGLVYTRRELWSQAEIFLDRCKTHATAADPTPDWLPDALAQLAQKLAEVDAAPIDIRVEPRLPSSRITVSSFPPDEQFDPRTIHLAPGTYVITASPPDRVPASASITVTSNTAQIITLVAAPLPPPPPPPPTRAERISRVLFYGAAGAAVVGLGFHLLSAQQRSDLSDAVKADDPVAWDAHSGTFTTERDLAIGLYSAAAIATTIGIILRVRDTESPMITGGFTTGGATVGLEWRR